MIPDEDAKRLYQVCQGKYPGYLNSDEPLKTQWYRGVGSHFWKNQHPGACERHMSVFNRFKVIPEYCFGCYKVFIEPRTVVELFKLMMVFEKMRLLNDNTRKCIVECREQVPGTYKGFVYCTGRDEGASMQKSIRKAVSEKISEKVPVTLKRGCSEYALAYPEYAKTEENVVAMEYKEYWRKYEFYADNIMKYDKGRSIIETHNSPGYTLQDTRIMFAWLSYAAMIGDPSYLKISDTLLPVTSNIKRPYPFNPVNE